MSFYITEGRGKKGVISQKLKVRSQKGVISQKSKVKSQKSKVRREL
ncbi:MAG: hypothetical protein SWX82_24850 [Cyanobacteriota bacterium]|nr:hypothetical protein [Cyanobacteriota bacterium]